MTGFPKKAYYTSPELYVQIIHSDAILDGSVSTPDFSLDQIEDGGEF